MNLLQLCIIYQLSIILQSRQKKLVKIDSMGSQNKKIETVNLKLKDIGELQKKEKCLFYPNFRKYGNFQIEIKSRILKAQFKIEQPQLQQLTISQQIFTDLEEAFMYKTKDILLHSVINDFDYHNIKIYNGTDNGKPVTVHLKPFNQFNSFAFISTLYQVNTHRLISKLQSPYLNTMTESYIVQTGLEAQGQENPNSHILVLSPVEASLSEIIKYRKQNNWPWTTNQFLSLCSDLLNAVKQLHKSNISHNDIRPSNIFYSSFYNCYQLGNFSSVVITERNYQKLGFKYNKLEMSAVRGSVNYSDPEMVNKTQTDLLKSDIFSLGVTLFSAFYLIESIKLQSIQKLNLIFKKDHPIIETLTLMVQKSNRRPNIEQIAKKIPKLEKQAQIKDLIESLKYRHIPKGIHQVEAKKNLSQAYKRLGLWNQWKQLTTEAYALQEKSLDDYKKAEALYQLARIQKCRGDSISAQQFAKSALLLYKQIGYSAYQQGNINQSLNLYEKAVECSKYFTNYWDIDSARILQHLAIIHAEKGQYGISRPLISQVCYMVLKNVGQQSIQYCQVKISQAKIESDFGLFQSADKILMQALAIANKKIASNDKEGQKLKAKILHEIGRNLMLNSSYQSGMQTSFISKAERYINQSILICQRDPQYTSELSANFNIVGQIELRKQNYTSAKLSFKKAFELIQQKMDKENNLNQLQKSRADCLCNLAICENALNNQKQALDYYTSAFEIYRKVYGTDHNKFSAISIGNMSKVYSKLGDQEKALDCLKIASQILQDLLGEQDPDYKHFKSLQENFWK